VLACAAVSATFELPTELHASVRMSALRVALDIAASLIALLAAFLVVGRFARRTPASGSTVMPPGWLRPHLAQGTCPLGGRRAADHFDP
jgi:hypothetical protein